MFINNIMVEICCCIVGISISFCLIVRGWSLKSMRSMLFLWGGWGCCGWGIGLLVLRSWMGFVGGCLGGMRV